MENKSQELRPYLKRLTDGDRKGELKTEWCFYMGPVTLWVFEYFNKRIDYYDRIERAKEDSPYDLMECYQQAMNENSLEEIFLQAASGKTKKGKPIRNAKSYIKGGIYNLIMDYFNGTNDANDHVSLDVEVHGNKALTQDKPYDEQDKDLSTVIARTLAKLTEPERKLFTEFMKSKTKDEAISKTEIPHATFFRKFDQACFHFLGNLGLEKVRPLIHDLNKRIVLDVLIWSKGDIPVAAEMLGKTYKDCRAAFKDMIPVLLRACGGIDGLMECCL
jgi:hypothetical protein